MFVMNLENLSIIDNNQIDGMLILEIYFRY